MLETINSVIAAISGVLYQPWFVPLFLVVSGIYFTFRCKFIQIRLFRDACKVIMEKPESEGSISSFGALMISTASRVGTGNIIGVSTAICLGGPGAIFWMWVTALLGGATAFIESTLAQIYKKRAPDGSCYGGPAYYMRDALGKRWLGVIFSVLIILIYAVGYNMLAAYNLQSTFSVCKFCHPVITPAFIGVIKAALNSRRAKEGDPVAQAAERVNEAEYERELTEERVMRAEAEAKAEARRRVAEGAQAPASETEEKGGE